MFDSFNRHVVSGPGVLSGAKATRVGKKRISQCGLQISGETKLRLIWPKGELEWVTKKLIVNRAASRAGGQQGGGQRDRDKEGSGQPAGGQKGGQQRGSQKSGGS